MGAKWLCLFFSDLSGKLISLKVYFTRTNQLLFSFWQLARQYDLLIIEDDRYFFLQFEKVNMVSLFHVFWLCVFYWDRALASTLLYIINRLLMPACLPAWASSHVSHHGRWRADHQDRLLLKDPVVMVRHTVRSPKQPCEVRGQGGRRK